MRIIYGLICASLVLSATSASAESLAEVKSRLPGTQAKIVNGVLESSYPTVGALLVGNNPDTASSWCSGTLIGCQTFLTAGHCVDGLTAADFIVFLPNAGFFSVISIAQHPSFNFPLADVAVLKLGSTVNGVAPSKINTTLDPPAGSNGTIVGFGRSGGSNYDYALKRSGAATTIDCPDGSFYADSVCWRYGKPFGPPGSNSDTCNADSGGPLFIDFGSGDTVAGITSGGTSTNCTVGDLSYDLDVYQFTSFIQANGGADLLNTSCGTLPQVGEPLSKVMSANGELDSSTPQVVHTFEVLPGTTVLRFAMTGTEMLSADFDLYVKHGSAPTTSVYDCRDIGPNQYSYCEFAAPASGTWYVMARRASGEGEYHVTVTAFGRDCSLPANDGLTCDDGNDCTSGDVCTGGACAGTAEIDGTPCDDDNECTNPDTCQSGACAGSAVIDGTPCDDGDVCSSPDSCQSGTCAGTVPAASCRAPFVAGRARFQLRDRTPNTGDRLVWKWVRGVQTLKAEFGTPTSSTDYTFCAYDETGGVPHRIIKQTMPAGSAWIELSNGYRYRDSDLTQGGIYSLLLKEGLDGKAKILLRGKAHPLQMPALGLDQDTKVTAQLLNGSTCWQAEYSTNIINDATQFKAKAD